MKTFFILFASSTLALAGFGAELVITGLTRGGQLSWTNAAATNASYRIEWAGSATGPWHPFTDLTNLNSIGATQSAMSVTVPMFYRVVWTDPPAPHAAGVWDFSGYSYDGSLVATGMITLSNRFGPSVVWGNWAINPPTNHLPCSEGEAAGSFYRDLRFSVNLVGCGLSEGVYFLDGTLLGDIYSGTWGGEGIVLSPIGPFAATRRQPQPAHTFSGTTDGSRYERRKN
jgi:hypothetical protein